MLTPPDDLTAEQVSLCLRDLWAIDEAVVSYFPAGQGSHNFTVRGTNGQNWFAKANRSGPNSDFFQATYRTAAELREGGLEFVLAPIRTRDGQVLPRVSPEWELGLFPHIDGRNPDVDSPRGSRPGGWSVGATALPPATPPTRAAMGSDLAPTRACATY